MQNKQSAAPLAAPAPAENTDILSVSAPPAYKNKASEARFSTNFL